MARTIGRTSIRDALDSATIALTAARCASPRLDAELLLAAATGLGRAEIVANGSRELEPDEARRFADLARRRREHEPVAYILGEKGFRSLELKVDARVLVPRPETEHVVEAALARLAAGARVVDVGTGSGAIALALKAERPDLSVVATDVSEDALAVARANALLLGLEVEFAHGDLLAPVSGPFDAVVSNPPYVADGDPLPPDVAQHEPAVALFAGPDGLDAYRRLLPAAAALGAALVVVEVGATQAAAVRALAQAAGYADGEVTRDLGGHERVVSAW